MAASSSSSSFPSSASRPPDPSLCISSRRYLCLCHSSSRTPLRRLLRSNLTQTAHKLECAQRRIDGTESLLVRHNVVECPGAARGFGRTVILIGPELGKRLSNDARPYGVRSPVNAVRSCLRSPTKPSHSRKPAQIALRSPCCICAAKIPPS